MKILRLVAALVLALAGLFAAAGPAHAAGKATISVLHGIPGATVDVYANGSELLKNFTPGTLTAPMMVPAGNYDLKVVKAGAGANGTAVVEAKGVTVPANANITVVAHLSASGMPMLTAFANDTSPSAKGARLTVRHVAAAPAVDVRANTSVVFSDLVNPNQAMTDIAPMTVSADVVLHGTSTVAIGPATLPIKAGMNTIVYAWGSAADKNLKLAVQTVALQGAPMPATGDGGSVYVGGQGAIPAPSAGPSDSYLYLAGGLLLLAALALASRRLVRERA